VDADAIELPEEAWIHSSVIGLSTRNYGGQQLSLRSDPREGASVVGRITVPEDLVRPLDITEDGEWVKVRWGKVTGWIERKWLCGNPLSSCS
jgi:SH3-like domain-containing protein